MKIKLKMKNYNTILTEGCKNISFIVRQIDKYKYLTGEEILPSNQQQIMEQAKFTYSPLGKAFEKQTKTIEDQGEKQIKAIQDNKKKEKNKQNQMNMVIIFLMD